MNLLVRSKTAPDLWRCWWQVQDSKLLRVRLCEPVMAHQGSMVAYQGSVDFSFEGGGASIFKKALTGEGWPLMRCQG